MNQQFAVSDKDSAARGIRLVDAVKPYNVRTGCGHIVTRMMRESTAGVAWSDSVVIEASGGMPCDDCQRGIPERPAHLIRVVVPRLNKCADIAQYNAQIESANYDQEWAEVSETVHLNCQAWNELMHSLLEDREWLSGKGGSSSWAFLNDSRDYFQLSEADQRLFKDTVFIHVVEVVAPTGLKIYIDPQGYNYARYVAFPAEGLAEPKTREQLARERAERDGAERIAKLHAIIAAPVNVPADHGIRFLWNGFKIAGGKLHRAHYSASELKHYPAGTISVYARDYESFPAELRKYFTVENNSESQSDYFDNDHFRVWPTHPLFPLVKSALDAQEAHNEKRHAKWLAARRTDS